jgi:RNA polymerase sigma factor (sigma-70 family)
MSPMQQRNFLQAILNCLDRLGYVNTDTDIGGHQRRFPSTRVSLLEAAATGLPNEAMEHALALYWKPVYHFIRSKFRMNNEDAKDLTQGFFADALQRDFFERFDPAKASFRTYLRMAVERYTANQYAAANRQKRGGDIEFQSVEECSATAESPERIYEREWQRQLFSLAIEDLRAYCDEHARQLPFRIFEAYDLTDGERPSYAALAASHGIPETAVTNHLAWARRMLRGFVTGRLRAVTSGERELREETRRLWT